MKSYSRIIRAVHSMPWAMQPEKLEAMLAFLELKLQGVGPSADTLAQIQRAAEEMSKRRADIAAFDEHDDYPASPRAARSTSAAAAGGGSVAVLSLYGMIMHRGNMMGDISGPSGTSTEQFTQQFRQAINDPNVKAIVIDVDSPGGSVEGVDELASEIRDSRKKKPVTAVSNCLMASAAYYIASACNEIVVAPSSLTGSIGVYSAHEDDSQYLENAGVKITLISYGANKTAGNAYEPLSDSARANMQELVDTYGLMFDKAVAKGRGVKLDDVQKKFGQGRVFPAQQAVKIGMADRVGTLDDVLSKYGVNRGGPVSAMASGEPALIESQTYARDEIAPIFSVKLADIVAEDDMDADSNEDCACECDPCMGGDCDACSHGDCACKGCSCAGALGSAANKAKHGARQRQLEIAAA